MNKTQIIRVVEPVKKTLVEHGPAICTGLAIAGFAGSVFSAVKATTKASMLIEERKIDLETDKLTPMETVRAVWFCYIPTAALFTISVGLIFGANNASAKRNAALATAYTLTETAFKDYKDKVVETIGEKKEKDIRGNVVKDKLEKNPVKDNEIVITAKGDSLCYEPLSGRYFKSDIEKIRKAVNEINRRLILDSYVSLNEFYDELGLEYTELGDDLGWRIESGLLEIDYYTQLAKNGEPCLAMDYVVRPIHDYNKWL